MPLLHNCIGPTIRIRREIHCLPNAGLFSKKYQKKSLNIVFLEFPPVLSKTTQLSHQETYLPQTTRKRIFHRPHETDLPPNHLNHWNSARKKPASKPQVPGWQKLLPQSCGWWVPGHLETPMFQTNCYLLPPKNNWSRYEWKEISLLHWFSAASWRSGRVLPDKEALNKHRESHFNQPGLSCQKYIYLSQIQLPVTNKHHYYKYTLLSWIHTTFTNTKQFQIHI